MQPLQYVGFLRSGNTFYGKTIQVKTCLQLENNLMLSVTVQCVTLYCCNFFKMLEHVPVHQC